MSTEQSRRVFIAGATGAIGRRLCLLLINDDWKVIGATRSSEKAAVLDAMGVEPVVVDVFDAALLRQVVVESQPQIVVHQLTDLPYALDPAKMAAARLRNARIRETGTANLVAAATAAGVQRMVAQSIAFAYQPGPIPYHEDAPLNMNDPMMGFTASAVASLERQVLSASFAGIVLRYGKLYGPGTGFDQAIGDAALHVDAAAHAARLALTQGTAGVYNIAESDGTVVSDKAMKQLGWRAEFRI